MEGTRKMDWKATAHEWFQTYLRNKGALDDEAHESTLEQRFKWVELIALENAARWHDQQQREAKTNADNAEVTSTEFYLRLSNFHYMAARTLRGMIKE